MLTEAQRSAIVDALIEANKTKVQTTRPSALYPDITFDDAYAISAETAHRQQEAGAKLIGYKVGLTSVAMRRSTPCRARVDLCIARTIARARGELSGCTAGNRIYCSFD